MTSLKIRNGLPQEVRDKNAQLLNQTLAETLDLLSQTKQAHWNVKGPNFQTLHLLFDTLASGLDTHVDSIAERIVALGHYAHGTLRNAVQASRLAEYPAGIVSGPEHLEALVERYAEFGDSVREAIDTTTETGDAGTADLYTALSRDLDQWLWFLQAHLYPTA